MNHPHAVPEDRFTQDVDRLLAGEAVPTAADEDYQADVELARMLSQVRYPPASRFESRLRIKLQNQLAQQEIKAMSPKRKISSWVRPLFVAGLSAALLFAALLVVSPEVRAAAQDWVARFVVVDSPWTMRSAAGQPAQSDTRPTVAAPADAAKSASAASQPANSASNSDLPKPGGDVGGPDVANLPKPDIQSGEQTISVEAAQAKLTFKIRVPSTLPDDYKSGRGAVFARHPC